MVGRIGFEPMTKAL